MEKNKKEGRYKRLYTQIEERLWDHYDPVARMATIVAVLHHKMDYFFWTGFYLIKDGELVVGPYQGPLACIRLAKNKGVCWSAVNRGKAMIVPDVHKFEGHIACDPRSNSEIVIPFTNGTNSVAGVLDIDSRDFNSFDEVDSEWLYKIVKLIYSI